MWQSAAATHLGDTLQPTVIPSHTFWQWLSAQLSTVFCLYGFRFEWRESISPNDGRFWEHWVFGSLALCLSTCTLTLRGRMPIPLSWWLYSCGFGIARAKAEQCCNGSYLVRLLA